MQTGVVDPVSVDITVALVGALAALVVGYSGGRMARHSDFLRHRRERVAEAYADYLNSVGEMETAKAASDQALAEATGRAIAAKARVCVDGSAQVVKALADLERRAKGEMRNKMVGLVNTMRGDVKAKGAVFEEDVNEILFGPPASFREELS